MNKLTFACIGVLALGVAAHGFAQSTYTEDTSYQGKRIGISTNDSIGFWGATPGTCPTAPAALTNGASSAEILAAVNTISSNLVARGLMRR